MSAAPVFWPATVTSFEVDADTTPPTWRAEFVLDESRNNLVEVNARGAYVTRSMLLAAWRDRLAGARAALAAAVKLRKAEEPDHHFKGLPECPRVIAAYDAVRAAEAEVARLERDGRRA